MHYPKLKVPTRNSSLAGSVQLFSLLNDLWEKNIRSYQWKRARKGGLHWIIPAEFTALWKDSHFLQASENHHRVVSRLFKRCNENKALKKVGAGFCESCDGDLKMCVKWFRNRKQCVLFHIHFKPTGVKMNAFNPFKRLVLNSECFYHSI